VRQRVPRRLVALAHLDDTCRELRRKLLATKNAEGLTIHIDSRLTKSRALLFTLCLGSGFGCRVDRSRRGDRGRRGRARGGRGALLSTSHATEAEREA